MNMSLISIRLIRSTLRSMDTSLFLYHELCRSECKVLIVLVGKTSPTIFSKEFCELILGKLMRHRFCFDVMQVFLPFSFLFLTFVGIWADFLHFWFYDDGSGIGVYFPLVHSFMES